MLAAWARSPEGVYTDLLRVDPHRGVPCGIVEARDRDTGRLAPAGYFSLDAMSALKSSVLTVKDSPGPPLGR